MVNVVHGAFLCITVANILWPFNAPDEKGNVRAHSQ